MRCFTILLVLASGLSYCQGEWDYIVVGGGASGCTAASQFAASGKKVIVLEAGGKTAWAFGGKDQSASFGYLESSTVFDVPGENEKLRWKGGYWWQNVPWGLNGRGIGGSGIMNGGLSFIPSPQDFDSWPSGWSYGDMASSFQYALNGLSVTSTPSADDKLYAQGAAVAFERLAEKHLGLGKVKLNANPGGRANTYSVTEVAAKDGRRTDPCQVFFWPAMKSSSNVEVEFDAEVSRISFKDKGHAKGVILKNDGREILLNEGGKIVLAAGVLQTARLLMLSGIGPRSELERLSSDGLVLNGEELWVDNNEVGKGVSDHTYTQMSFRVPNVPDFTFRYYQNQNDLAAALNYLKSASGPYAQYGAVRVGFLARPGQSAPDVELLVMPSGIEGGGDKDCNTCFRILVMPLYPKARADIHIKTSNGYCDCGGRSCSTGDICKPGVYLSTQEDKDIVQWAIEKISNAANAEGYEILTSSSGSFPASHWTGTCKLGQCVGTNLKVKGTGNVFVVDLSVVPSPVRAHTFITAIAVAHKASSVIQTVFDQSVEY